MSDPIIILLSVPLTKLHQRNLRQQRVSNINQSIFFDDVNNNSLTNQQIKSVLYSYFLGVFLNYKYLTQFILQF